MLIPQEDGVYVYSDGTWSRVYSDGPFVPSVDGVYVYYFRNRRCPGCKAFDATWLRAVKRSGSELHGVPVVIQCTNFFIECSDQSARDTFILFLITVTPQVVVVVIENGELKFAEREYGALDYDKLLEFVNGVRKRMDEYLVRESEEEGEGLYIELVGNWKKVVERIEKMIFEGRNLREVCDESGCRVYVE